MVQTGVYIGPDFEMAVIEKISLSIAETERPICWNHACLGKTFPSFLRPCPACLMMPKVFLISPN